MSTDPDQATAPPSAVRHDANAQTSPAARRAGFISETPRLSRPTVGDNLPADRPQYGQEMDKEILEVSRQSFMENYAPFEPTEAEVQACLKQLCSRSPVQVQSKNNRPYFVACNGKPSGLFDAEKAYVFLSKICHAIGMTRLKGREATCELEQRPDNTTDSEISGASHKVDGYFKLYESTVPVEAQSNNTPTADLAVNCEWKLRFVKKEVLDNRLKAVSCASHVMSNDPRRMFTYSITIEDELMTLWYWSRSHSAKSASFKFTTDIPATISALASFLFATTEELGYDPTIQRRFDSSRKQHQLTLVFQVQDRYFKHLRSISEHLGLCITGRATRVFEVIEVKSFDDLTVIGKSSKILKDVWLDVEARTEKQIQDAIFSELEEMANKLAVDGSPEAARFSFISDNDKELVRKALQDQRYKQHFLSIECDYLGATSKLLATGAVPLGNLFSSVDPVSVPAALNYSDPSRCAHVSSTASSSRKNALNKGPAPNLRRYVPKRQYRTVCSEVCQALHKVPDLPTVLQAMEDCLLTAELLFLVGWVHRDISAGNLLWFPGREGRGILSDLEYAKKFNPDGQGSPDPKTGTPYFMSIEIQRRAYLYNPESASEAVSTDALDVFYTGTQAIKAPPIIYNFQHDLDSFFWLFLWTITSRVDKADLQSLGDLIFQNTSICSQEREQAFVTANSLAEELELLLPEALQGFAKYVEAFRFLLRNAYKARKFNIGESQTYSNLYPIARKILDACLLIAAQPGVPQLIVHSAREDIQSRQPDRIPFESRKRALTPVNNASVSYKSQKSERSERAEKRETKKRELGL